MKKQQKLMDITMRLKAIYPEMTIKQLQIFLEVYRDEGHTQFHYGKKCGESEAAVSRTVTRLGDILGLISLGKTPDNRSKALFISPEGKELIKSIRSIIEE